ncbi:uroporphyrinogen decarboxylase family protein [Fructilactobacillus frigidiflavus]|uniref:uroporphyrinogen decarboxylase family protein n=1 Tax=Fructilactobacillus frigidiflavus TaxID=3242688 RepID=UPI003756ECD6
MSKEQLINVFTGKNEDFIPFSVWHHFNPNEHIEATDDDDILKNDLEKEINYVDNINPDFIKLMNDGLFTYDFNGVTNPRDIDDLKNIKPINDNDKWLKKQTDLITKQLEKIGKDKLVLSNVFSAVTLFKWKLVEDTPEKDLAEADHLFANLYIENPEVILNALKTINQDIKKQIKTEKSAGVDGVLFSTQEIQDDRITKEFFDTVQKPLDLELVDEINHQFDVSILHICGFDEAKSHLPWFTDYNLPVVNWSTSTDDYTLGEGKKLFKDKVVFGGLGNTTNDVLFKGSKEEIEDEINSILDEAGTDRVIIGADCTVPRETPFEHIKWANDAVHNYKN